VIGLSGLQDGGHVLEHPAGPLYVNVKHGAIRAAELAPWGEPLMVSWQRDKLLERVEARIQNALSGKGVMPDRI
jgi:hypothetical protein